MRYIVGFCKAQYPAWWTRLIHPQFQHCWVAKDNGFYFDKIECLTNIIHTDIILYDSPIPTSNRCVEIYTDPNPLKPFGVFHHLNCVSVVKKILGIKDYAIFTPYRLYKHLINIGGKEYG